MPTFNLPENIQEYLTGRYHYLKQGKWNRLKCELICSKCGTPRFVDMRNLKMMKTALCDSCNKKRYRGGKGYITSRGYKRIPIPKNHPFACMIDAHGTVWEHRFILAKKLGRPLSTKEVAHHVNGDVTDNRPENLELSNKSKHARYHNIKRYHPDSPITIGES